MQISVPAVLLLLSVRLLCAGDITAPILSEPPESQTAAEVSKPEFIVPPDQIIKEEVHEQGGRDIIVREIEPIALPEPEQPAKPQEPLDPEAHRQLLEHLGLAHMIFLNGGATVYHAKTSPVRSLVKFHTPSGMAVEFWSSADFGLLCSIPEFPVNDGTKLRLFMMWMPVDLDREEALAARFGKTYKRPQIPDLPAGNATFIVKSENPDPSILAQIQILHDVYNAKYTELVAAAEARKIAQAQREAEPLPAPKDIILNHWRIGGADEEEGAR